MTVITQAISDKKQQKEPLVGAEELPSSTDASIDVEQQGPSSGRQGRAAALLVQLQRNRVHQIHSLTTICVFLLALAVFTAGVFASFYVYQNYTQYKLRHFKGWCGVPYVSEEEPEKLESLFERVQALSDSMGTDTNNGMSGKDLLEEEFELDLEFDSYEKIEVPEFARGRRGRFIHDFSLNKTGIIDMDGGRCFVMDLNRSRIVPPKTLFDMINKINSGFYDVDTQVVRENYRVVTPPLEKSDEDEYGMYITNECSSFPMYRLERMTSPVFKRSTSPGEKAVFTEFAGKQISQIYIMNLGSIPGNRK